jgi:2'-5' RNA ligase
MDAAQPANTLRLFFALVPDAPLRDALAALAKGVAQRVHGKPVAGANVHLTLAFLGDTPSSALATLTAIGERLPREPVALTLDRIGGFRASGVAWAGADEVPPALLSLHGVLNDELARNGYAIEDRPFRAHVTLARKCRKVVRETLAPPLLWNVEEVVLVASTLAAGGSVYRTLAAWPLATPHAQDATGTV